jgi:hypothetical protein
MDLIGSVASQLGIDPATAQSAVGSVLGALKQAAPPETFAEVEDKVPETSQWLAAAPAGGGGGGGLGDLLGGAINSLDGGGSGGAGLGGLLGGLGGLAGVVSALGKLGLSPESLGKLVPLVLQFLKSRAGEGLVAKLVAAVPALAPFAPFLAGAGGQSPAAAGDSPFGGLGGLFK